MKDADWLELEVVEYKTRHERKWNRRYPSLYRDRKVAVHTTSGGKGRIAKVRERMKRV